MPFLMGFVHVIAILILLQCIGDTKDNGPMTSWHKFQTWQYQTSRISVGEIRPAMMCRETETLCSTNAMTSQYLIQPNPTQVTQGCDRSNVEAAFPANQSVDKMWSVGSPINLSFQLCRGNSVFKEELKFFLERNSSIILEGSSTIGDSKIYTCHTTSSNLQISCERYSNQLFRFNISILEARQEYNSSVVQVYRNFKLIFQTSSLLIKHCSVNDFPENLIIERSSTTYAYRDVAFAKCKNSGRFLDGTRYSDYLNISCAEYAKWEVPNHICSQMVDFKKARTTLISGESMIFICESDDSSNLIQMTIGRFIVKGKVYVWHNITITSHLHDVIAECEEIGNDGEVFRKKRIRLNVLFPPELAAESGRNVYELENQSRGEVMIEFRANPPLTLHDIKVLRNGTSILNYYLLLNDLKNKVVIDFIKVGKHDFGDYTLIVTSHSPVPSVLVQNFSIHRHISDSVAAAAKELTTPEAVGVTIGVTAAFALTVVVVLILWKKFCTNKIKKKDDATVTYEANDPHNYEEIGVKAGIRRQVDLNTALAISVHSPQDGQSQVYETPIGAITKPVEVTYG